MNQDAFINGFVKRAKEYGLTDEQITKMAADVPEYSTAFRQVNPLDWYANKAVGHQSLQGAASAWNKAGVPAENLPWGDILHKFQGIPGLPSGPLEGAATRQYFQTNPNSLGTEKTLNTTIPGNHPNTLGEMIARYKRQLQDPSKLNSFPDFIQYFKQSPSYLPWEEKMMKMNPLNTEPGKLEQFFKHYAPYISNRSIGHPTVG